MRSAKTVALTLAAVATLAAFVFVRGPSTGGPVLRDFEAYVAGGSAWRDRMDPYGSSVWRTERTIPGVVVGHGEELPFVGPPFGLPLWGMLSAIPWRRAVSVWQAVLAAAAIVLAIASLRTGGGHARFRDALALAVVALGFGPLTSGLALGQVAVVSTAAIVLVVSMLDGPPRHAPVRAPSAAQAARPAASVGAVLAVPIAMLAALQPNLALVLAARVDGKRAAVTCSGAACLALVGSAFALGSLQQVWRYANVVRAQAQAERFIAIQVTPGAVARAFGAPAHLAESIALICACFVTAVVAGQSCAGRYAPTERVALACAALPMALPFAHEHDLSIAFFPAIVTARRARGALWTCAAAGALLVATDWLGLAQRPQDAAQTLLLTLAAALALIELAPENLGWQHALPVLLGFAVLGVAFPAATHRLPVWPDALPAHFHVPPTASAPTIWRLEQVASGVADPGAASAWLRMLSLAGCALLWLAASLALARHDDDAGARTAPTLNTSNPEFVS